MKGALANAVNAGSPAQEKGIVAGDPMRLVLRSDGARWRAPALIARKQTLEPHPGGAIILTYAILSVSGTANSKAEARAVNRANVIGSK